MYDVIIIGAGVVGCSCAYYLSRYDLKVAVLEKENDVSLGTTKANSAIIHAGFDPEEGTLMAFHNVRGAKLTKDLCRDLDVPYQQCGAMVLAFNEEDNKTIEMLYQRGLANGVEGLKLLNKEETLQLEPNVSPEVTGCLLAGTSAIISPWEFTLAMAETAVKNGVEVKLNNGVESITKENGIFTVTTGEGQYQSKYIVNAAGVDADKVHEMIGEKEFTIKPSKGEYYLLDKSEGNRTTHTIFQCPTKVGKGVLVSPTVAGNLIVGPTTEDSDSENTDTSADGLAFIKETGVKSVPSIDFRENIRNFAGIRARSDHHDFIVSESQSVENFFNLAGIKSPGLSSAPSLGLSVVEWLQEKGEQLNEKQDFIFTRKKVRMKDLSIEEKCALIKERPEYGRIICRCETVSEGEIMDAIHSTIPAVSIDGVKRRCGAGFGRCQGGFCGERVASILMRELNISGLDVLQDQKGSNILLAKTKGGKA